MENATIVAFVAFDCQMAPQISAPTTQPANPGTEICFRVPLLE